MITTQENFTVHIIRQNGRILMAVRDNNADGEVVLSMYLTDKDAAGVAALLCKFIDP